MTEQWIMIAVGALVVLGIEALLERRLRLEREHYKRREDALMKLVHNQSNRLTSKDLSGYMALEHDDLRRRGDAAQADAGRLAERDKLAEEVIQDELASILEQNGASREA
jgi:hypothetical protein